MRRVFKTRHFHRWMRKTELTDDSLCAAVHEMSAGLIDAELGGDVFKKRVALAGRGKRAGARTLVATRKGKKWFFVFGFEKHEKSNISPTELEAVQALATDLLSLSATQLNAALQDGSLLEICHEQ